MRHLIALVALAAALISTPAFPEWETSHRTDNLTGLTHPSAIFAQGRLTHDGSPQENHIGISYSAINYLCRNDIIGIKGTTAHQGAPKLDTANETGTGFETGTLRGVFDGPNRPVNKVENFTFYGGIEEEKLFDDDIVYLTWSMIVSEPPPSYIPDASSGLFEKIKTGEVTSIKIEFPTESGDLVFEYDTDNFPADFCEGK